jgi:hypothetical protein
LSAELAAAGLGDGQCACVSTAPDPVQLEQSGGQRSAERAREVRAPFGPAAALIAFLLVEHRHPEPMLPLGYFRSPAYAAANADGLVMGFVMFSLLFMFALYFQQVVSDSALGGGLSFIPLCGAFAITGPLIGRLVHRVGHRAPMVGGLALIALGALLLLRLSVHSGYGQVWPAFLIIGVGYGMTSTPMAAAVLGAVPADRAGMASATNNTARQVGGVFGIAILGSLLPATARSSSYAQHFIVGLHHGVLAYSTTETIIYAYSRWRHPVANLHPIPNRVGRVGFGGWRITTVPNPPNHNGQSHLGIACRCKGVRAREDWLLAAHTPPTSDEARSPTASIGIAKPTQSSFKSRPPRAHELRSAPSPLPAWTLPPQRVPRRCRRPG